MAESNADAEKEALRTWYKALGKEKRDRSPANIMSEINSLPFLPG